MDNLAIVKTSIGTLKLKPGFEFETADETLFGRIVNILEKAEDDWYLVETDYRYKGYMHGSQLLIDNHASTIWDKEANHVITWAIIDVLKEPKFQSYQIESLTRGSVIKLTNEVKDKWIKIQLPTGEYGWLRNEFIGDRIRSFDNEREKEFRRNVVETCMKYLGTQYRWGGKSPLGIDCSGLSSIAYLMNGVVIYRDAKIVEGFPIRDIPIEDRKPGDLLFWPGHVAIYLGDDKYIHSTGASAGVVINSLNPNHNDYRSDLVKIHNVGSIF